MMGDRSWPRAVTVAHPNQALRAQLVRSLREAGAAIVHSVADLKLAKDILEAEPVDWLWTATCQDGEVNLFQILDLICANSSLKNTRVSAFFANDELNLVPAAFAYGLMTWHRAAATAGGAAQALNEARQLLARHNQIPALAAGQQLAAVLKERRQPAPRRQLLRELATLFPNSSWVLLAAAEAECEAGDLAAGARTLKLARAQGFKGWEPLAKKYLGRSFDSASARVFDVNTYIVVEPDETVHNHIDALMRPFGARKALHFTDAGAALRWLEAKPGGGPDLIIQEWKLPAMGGSNFLQRARSQIGNRKVPVLVVSSLVRKSDEPILREMGVARTIEKPLIDHEFLSSISATLQEYQEPQSPRFIERRIQMLFEDGESERARCEANKVLKDPSLTPNARNYVQGLLNYHSGDYARAKDDFSRCLTDTTDQARSGDKAIYLNALARCLVRIRDFRGAARCYEKAQKLSPANVGRLLELSETYAEDSNFAAAESALSAAETLDAENPEVRMMQVRHALRKDSPKDALALARTLGETAPLIADLNNTGVALVKTGNITKGIDLYQQTLTIMASRESTLWRRVNYNLALAQAKAGRARAAVQTLEAILISGSSAAPDAEEDESALRTKSESLLDKLKRHLEDGKPLQFTSSDSTAVPPINESFWSRFDGQQSIGSGGGAGLGPRCCPDGQAGDRCLHLVFHAPLELMPRPSLSPLVNRRLGFQPRAAINKDASRFSIEFEGFGDDPAAGSSPQSVDWTSLGSKTGKGPQI